MSKIIVSTKKTNAIFLAVVLVTGTFALISPSFIGGAEAYPDYGGMDSKYKSKYSSYGHDYNDKPKYPPYKHDKPKYPSYKPDYSKDKDSVSIKKIKCNNVNVNVNDLSVNIGPDVFATGSAENAEAAALSPQSLTNDGTHNGFKKFDKDFVFICINNNNNAQQGETPTPPPVELANLNVIKTVECQSVNGEPSNDEVCAYVLANISPEDYEITVTGNNPDQLPFPGSSNGKNVQLGEGDYVVDEEFADTSQLQTALGATSIITTADVDDAISDCEAVFDVNNVFQEAIGTIASGESQTCAIINTVNVNGGTVPDA